MRLTNFGEVFSQTEDEDAIAEVELLLGKELPADYKHFLGTLGGQVRELIPPFRLLSLSESSFGYNELLSHWQGEFDECSDGMLSIEGPVKDLYKNKLWWPVMSTNNDYVCIDMDPAPGGHSGQVVYVIIRAYRIVVADSFSEFFSNMVDFLVTSQEELSEALDDDDLTDELSERFSEEVLSSTSRRS